MRRVDFEDVTWLAYRLRETKEIGSIVRCGAASTWVGQLGKASTKSRSLAHGARDSITHIALTTIVSRRSKTSTRPWV